MSRTATRFTVTYAPRMNSHFVNRYACNDGYFDTSMCLVGPCKLGGLTPNLNGIFFTSHTVSAIRNSQDTHISRRQVSKRHKRQSASKADTARRMRHAYSTPNATCTATAHAFSLAPLTRIHRQLSPALPQLLCPSLLAHVALAEACRLSPACLSPRRVLLDVAVIHRRREK